MCVYVCVEPEIKMQYVEGNPKTLLGTKKRAEGPTTELASDTNFYESELGKDEWLQAMNWWRKRIIRFV